MYTTWLDICIFCIITHTNKLIAHWIEPYVYDLGFCLFPCRLFWVWALASPGWPQTHHVATLKPWPSASTSQTLGFHMCTTMPGFALIFQHSLYSLNFRFHTWVRWCRVCVGAWLTSLTVMCYVYISTVTLQNSLLNSTPLCAPFLHSFFSHVLLGCFRTLVLWTALQWA